MDKLDRMQQLHQLFTTHRHPIQINTLAEKLECTPKTVRRLIDSLRDYFSAPVDYVQGKGWAYVNAPGELFQLPGLWVAPPWARGLKPKKSTAALSSAWSLRERHGCRTQRLNGACK